MTPLLVLQHSDDVPVGWLGDALCDRNVRSETVRLHRGEALPEVTGERAVVCLGGQMGAYETDRHPWLVDEKRFLRRAVDHDVPVLGICLGAQLLADALGGRAYAAPGPEFGYHPVHLTDAGSADPVLRSGVDPVLSWHGDTFDPPPDATLLAHTDRHPHAFRLGSALALQFHAEAGPRLLAGWLRSTADRDLRAEGLTAETALAQARTHERAARGVALRLFSRWLDETRPRRVSPARAAGRRW